MVKGEKAKDFKGSLRRLLSYLRPHRVKLVVVFALAIASTVFTISAPKIQGRVMNKVKDSFMSRIILDQMADTQSKIRMEIGRQMQAALAAREKAMAAAQAGKAPGNPAIQAPEGSPPAASPMAGPEIAALVKEFMALPSLKTETDPAVQADTVRKMIDLAREFSDEQGWPLRIGVSCGLGDVQPWKHDADAWYVQVSYSADVLTTWRQGITFDGAVYAGVMVIPSARMARKLTADVPQLAVPSHLVEMVDHDPNAGVAYAADLIDSIATTNQFDGVHLVPVARYREIASALLDRR